MVDASGLRVDSSWRFFVFRWAFFALIIISISAWTSETIHHPDEHFQIVNFLSYKLGITPPEKLDLEFKEQMRPGLQVAFYYLFCKPLFDEGFKNPFILTFLCRWITGFFYWVALFCLMLCCYRWFSDEKMRQWCVRALATTWYIPYLSVRT